MISQFSFIHWFLILIFGIAGLIFLVFAIRQFVSVKLPLQRNDQTRRSLIIAGWTSVSWFFIAAIAGVFLWAETGILKSMVLFFPIFLCLAPFLFATVAFGTFIQFIWYAKLYKYRDDTIKKIVERYDK
jgi:hypothetical protein